MTKHLMGWMALALAVAGASLWLGQGLWQGLAALLLALGALTGTFWLAHVEAARRLRAVVNTYAEREERRRVS
jgi:hypothetical protein